MFPVEVRLPDEGRLFETMQAMRTWLDHRHCEPAAFRYSRAAVHLVFRVDFARAAEAAAFARQFSGGLVPA